MVICASLRSDTYEEEEREGRTGELTSPPPLLLIRSAKNAFLSATHPHFPPPSTVPEVRAQFLSSSPQFHQLNSSPLVLSLPPSRSLFRGTSFPSSSLSRTLQHSLFSDELPTTSSSNLPLICIGMWWSTRWESFLSSSRRETNRRCVPPLLFSTSLELRSAERPSLLSTPGLLPNRNPRFHLASTPFFHSLKSKPSPSTSPLPPPFPAPSSTSPSLVYPPQLPYPSNTSTWRPITDITTSSDHSINFSSLDSILVASLTT